MKFVESAVGGASEILVAGPHTLTPITVAEPAGDDKVVKQGTPLDENGAEANTASAIGILLYDVDTEANPNGTIIRSGPIDSKKAQEISGITYSAAMTGALGSIIFRTNIGVNE